MWRIGWPVFVSGICRLAMVSMDVLFVGHLPPASGPHSPVLLENMPMLGSIPRLGAELVTGRRLEEISTETFMSAASLSDMCTTVLFVPMMAFGVALNPLVGQAMGSGNKKMAGVWLQLSLLFMVGIFSLTMVLWMFIEQFLVLVGFPRDVSRLAGLFARISAIWPIPNGVFLCLRCYFQAMGNSRPAMWAGVIFVGINALLNWTFVYGGPFKYWASIGWGGIGFIGAAVSMDVSRTMQPFCYWVYMFVWKKAHVDAWPGFTKQCLQRQNVRAFAAQACPQVGTLLLQISILQCTTLMVGKLGKLAVAAASAAMWGLAPLAWSINFTWSTLTAMRVGYYLGQGDPVKAKRCAWMCITFGMLLSLLLIAVILPLSPWLMDFMTSADDVRAVAVRIIPPLIISNMFALIVQVCTGGIFAAQGRTRFATYMSLFFEMPVTLGPVIFLALYIKPDVHYLYWCQAASNGLETLVVTFIVRKSDWARFAREAQERQGMRARAVSAQEESTDVENKKTPDSNSTVADEATAA